MRVKARQVPEVRVHLARRIASQFIQDVRVALRRRWGGPPSLVPKRKPVDTGHARTVLRHARRERRHRCRWQRIALRKALAQARIVEGNNARRRTGHTAIRTATGVRERRQRRTAVDPYGTLNQADRTPAGTSGPQGSAARLI